ncbi:MAG: response regulator [Candidatus Lokiarchaeota archaeon]|nr:response regulator [Candidatus Lokiarchaeota archaeon]
MENDDKKAEEMKRIGILVSETTKSKWQDFVDTNEFTTISMLIRKAVNFFIDSKIKIEFLENISKFAHDLKEPLTSIKGFSQLIIENYSNNVDTKILLRIKEIFNQSIFLEDKINEYCTSLDTEEESYDILIIDDDALTIMVLTDFFELKGCTCKGIKNGTQALDHLKRTKPKIILLDIILPDIDGYEICKRIKSDENLKEIPIYFITAIPVSEINKKIESTGAEGYFLKPFEFDDFETILNTLNE